MLCPIPWNLSSFASVEGLESNIVDEISQTIDKVGDTIESGKDYVSDLLSQAADTVSDWASEVRDDVSDTVNTVADDISETMEAGYGYVSDTASQVADKVGEMLDTGKDYASNAVEETIEKAEEITAESKNAASTAVDTIQEQSTGFWGVVAQKSGIKTANGYVNDAMAWTNRNLMVTDYPVVHQTYQAAKTLGKTFGLVGMAMTGKSIYDDFKNYQGLNCAKAVAIDTGAFIGGWLVTAGVTYVASFLAVPTAFVFGGAVALGAGGTMIAKSIKDSITKENDK